MAAQRTSFGKLQRDRAKKAKAALKRERRQEGAVELDPADPADGEGLETDEPITDDGQPISAPELLKRIETVHRRFDEGTISYEDFEEEKAELLARLPID